MFIPMTEAEYRSLDLDALNERRALVADLLMSGGDDVDVEQLRAEANIIKAEVARRNEAAELRSAVVAEVAAGAGEVRAQSAPAAPAREGIEFIDGTEDPFASSEYERAFAAYITRGAAIPSEFHDALRQRAAATRAGDVTLTTDAPVAIPTTLQNRIIEKAENYGKIFSAVTKTNVPGGIEIPVGAFSAEAHWIGETEVSEYQKLGLKDKISFSYYGLECRLAQSILANVTTIAMFQAKFSDVASKAMVKAQEKAIMRGTGQGQYTGILVEKRIPDDQKLGITEDECRTWAGWHKAVKKFIKSPYSDGVFYMNESTFDEYIDGMVDTAGQPVARVNYGLSSEASNSFLGKRVEFVEDDILPELARVSGAADFDAENVFCVFGRMSDYVINSNLSMQATRWVDHETNQVKDKLLLIADGKVVDPYGFKLIYKKPA